MSSRVNLRKSDREQLAVITAALGHGVDVRAGGKHLLAVWDGGRIPLAANTGDRHMSNLRAQMRRLAGGSNA